MNGFLRGIGSASAWIVPNAGVPSSGLFFTRTGRSPRWLLLITALAGGFLAAQDANAATFTVSVSLSTSIASPASFQQDLLSNLTTGFYLGTVTPGILSNTYNVKVTGKNPSFQPVVGPSAALITLDSIIEKGIKISTDSYVYGFANGMSYERADDLRIISGFGATCSTGSIRDAICIKSSSAPVVIPGF